jgi:CHAD domain-containing protein
VAVDRAYYAGGCRIVIDGTPMRVARRPSDANLKDLRSWEAYRAKPDWSGPGGRLERARHVAKQAREEIESYADALDITVTRAKALIAQQRAHVTQNPLVDLSLEYDL